MSSQWYIYYDRPSVCMYCTARLQLLSFPSDQNVRDEEREGPSSPAAHLGLISVIQYLDTSYFQHLSAVCLCLSLSSWNFMFSFISIQTSQHEICYNFLFILNIGREQTGIMLLHKYICRVLQSFSFTKPIGKTLQLYCLTSYCAQTHCIVYTSILYKISLAVFFKVFYHLREGRLGWSDVIEKSPTDDEVEARQSYNANDMWGVAATRICVGWKFGKHFALWNYNNS